MLASLTRSAGKGIALGYATLMIVAIATSSLEEFFNIVIKYSTGFTNVSYLLISENSKYEVINGETISVFDTSVTGEMIWKTIAMSAIFTVIYLTVTYINFKKTDRD